MTTREVYFKALYYNELPKGILCYITEQNGTIRIGHSICLEFRNDEATIEKSINTMKEIEAEPNFKCWAISNEGQEILNNIKWNKKC